MERLTGKLRTREQVEVDRARLSRRLKYGDVVRATFSGEYGLHPAVFRLVSKPPRTRTRWGIELVEGYRAPLIFKEGSWTLSRNLRYVSKGYGRSRVRERVLLIALLSEYEAERRDWEEEERRERAMEEARSSYSRGIRERRLASMGERARSVTPSRVEQLRLDKAAVDVGSSVTFVDKAGNESRGTVVKKNPKTARIEDAAGKLWNVPYAGLERIRP